MGRQVRKVAPWMGMFEAHLHSNHTIHRLYRWTTYHSHPTMRAGSHFKTRGSGRPYLGMLLTPDALKYRIPIPFAFVRINEKDEARAQYREKYIHKPGRNERNNDLLSKINHYAEYEKDVIKNNQECHKMLINFENCMKNNQAEMCGYYNNYLNKYCIIKK